MVRLFAPLLAVALLSGCFEAPTEVTSDIAVLIGEAGGTVDGPGLTLEIPAGALSGDTLIRATRFRTLPPGIPNRVVGDAWLIQPEGLLFAKPVRLEMALSDGSPSRVFIATAPAETTRFELLNATHTSKAATTAITHLSIFVPVTNDERTDGGTDGGQTDAGVFVDAGIIPSACSPVPANSWCVTDAGATTRLCNEPTPVGCTGTPDRLEVTATHLVWSTGSDVWARNRAQSNAVLLSTGKTAFSLTLDSDNAYWMANDGIYAAPLNGGVRRVLASGTLVEGDIAVDSTYVYWTTGIQGVVAKISKATGSSVEIVAVGEPTPRAMALDATNMYWISPTKLRRAPLAGGAATTLQTLPSGENRGLVAVGGYLYWSAETNRQIQRMPIAGGSIENLAQGALGNFATDGTTLLWSAPDPATTVPAALWAQPVAGGPSVKLLQLSSHAPVAVDFGSYFFSAGGLWRMSR